MGIRPSEHPPVRDGIKLLLTVRLQYSTVTVVLGLHDSVPYIIRRYFQHDHFIPIVGVGKRGAY